MRKSGPTRFISIALTAIAVLATPADSETARQMPGPPIGSQEFKVGEQECLGGVAPQTPRAQADPYLAALMHASGCNYVGKRYEEIGQYSQALRFYERGCRVAPDHASCQDAEAVRRRVGVASSSSRGAVSCYYQWSTYSNSFNILVLNSREFNAVLNACRSGHAESVPWDEYIGTFRTGLNSGILEGAAQQSLRRLVQMLERERDHLREATAAASPDPAEVRRALDRAKKDALDGWKPLDDKAAPPPRPTARPPAPVAPPPAPPRPLAFKPIPPPPLPYKPIPGSMAKACADRTTLAARLAELERQAGIARQVLKNYAFANTAAEFRTIGDSLESGAARQGQRVGYEAAIPSPLRNPVTVYVATGDADRLKKELKSALLTKAETALKEFVTSMVSPGQYAIDKYQNVIRLLHLPASLDKALWDFALNPDARKNVTGYKTALEAIGKLDLIFELATEENEKELVWKGIMAAAGEVSPVYGILLKEIDWAGRNLYDAGTGKWAALQINKLTTMTEAELKDLRGRSDQLVKLTTEIASTRKSLRDAPACDSTQLVR